MEIDTVLTHMEKVRKLVNGMVKENTGAHFLDSGGAYGRHWEKNQGRDFESEPEVEIAVDYLEVGDIIDPMINVYHFLVNNIQLDSLCEEYNEKFARLDDWDGEACGTSEESWNWLASKGFHVVDTINTYNGESILSQNLQYSIIRSIEFGEYILLQVHNGCDARCGYTRAKLVMVEDGYFCEGAYGIVKYPDGRIESVNTRYNGYCLTDAGGNEILYEEGMTFDLGL